MEQKKDEPFLNRSQITFMTLVILGIIVGGILFMIRISTNNTDAGLRNKAKAQQTVNMATKDKVWRILKQQVFLNRLSISLIQFILKFLMLVIKIKIYLQNLLPKVILNYQQICYNR